MFITVYNREAFCQWSFVNNSFWKLKKNINELKTLISNPFLIVGTILRKLFMPREICFLLKLWVSALGMIVYDNWNSVRQLKDRSISPHGQYHYMFCYEVIHHTLGGITRKTDVIESYWVHTYVFIIPKFYSSLRWIC